MTNALNMRNFRSKNEWNKDLVISADEVREIFLFGVDLTDDDGRCMSDSLIEFYIRGAQDWFERIIGGISLTPIEVEEYHDYHFNDYIKYSFTKLFRYPVTCVDEYGIIYPTSENGVVFDPSWYKVESVGAQVTLIPTSGTISQIMMSQGGAWLPYLYRGRSWVPDIIRVKYMAGFPKGKVPPEIIEIIGKRAALGPLNIAGDLIAGAGIASKSISLDGLSQSIGTTSSATNAGYGARIIQYTKDIDAAIQGLRNSYIGLQMVVA